MCYYDLNSLFIVMDLYYFLKSSFRGTFITLMIGMAAFSVVLVTTLNLTTSLLIFLFFVSVAIFQKSFSRGWLFMLAILLIFPSMKIGGTIFSIHDIFLVILGIIGLGMILIENLKIPLTSISYNIFLMELVGLSTAIFAKIFGYDINPFIWIILIVIAIYWVVMTSFQYFFQTLKRMRRFFIMLIAIAVVHSIFGIVAFLLGVQTPTGLGISSGKMQFLFFNNIDSQINGLLGDGYVLRVGANALAPYLLITIPMTFSLILGTKKRKRIQRPLKKLEKTIKKFDVSQAKNKIIKKMKVKFLGTKEWLNKHKIEELVKGKPFMFVVLTIQIAGLLLTFSYASLLILAIGIFVFGILLRSKKMISTTAIFVIALTLVLPGSGATIESFELTNAKWISDWGKVQDDLLMGSEWNIRGDENNEAGVIKNSYILVWTHFGFLGIIAFMFTLWTYINELYKSYKTSDGEKRIWLIGIIAVFFEFIFLGFTNNSFFFGPAAIAFWLLFGAGVNLRRREIIFGITETHFDKNKLL